MTYVDIFLGVKHVTVDRANEIAAAVRAIPEHVRFPFDVEIREIDETKESFTELIVTPMIYEAGYTENVAEPLTAINDAVMLVNHGQQLEGYWREYSGDKPDCLAQFNGAGVVEYMESSWVFELPMDVAQALRDFAFRYNEEDPDFLLSYLQSAGSAYREKIMKKVKRFEQRRGVTKWQPEFVVEMNDPRDTLSPFALKLVVGRWSTSSLRMLREGNGTYEFVITE